MDLPTLAREEPKQIWWWGPRQTLKAVVIALVVNSDVVNGSKMVSNVSQCQLQNGEGKEEGGRKDGEGQRKEGG